MFTCNASCVFTSIPGDGRPRARRRTPLRGTRGGDDSDGDDLVVAVVVAVAHEPRDLTCVIPCDIPSLYYSRRRLPPSPAASQYTCSDSFAAPPMKSSSRFTGPGGSKSFSLMSCPNASRIAPLTAALMRSLAPVAISRSLQLERCLRAGLALFTTFFCAVKTQIDDSYPCNQSDTQE
jgi:hypothetical protein